MGPETPACLSPPLSRPGPFFSIYWDVLPDPLQPLVLLGKPHPHPHHTDLANTRSSFPCWKTPGSSARAPCTGVSTRGLASPARGQWGARNKPKSGDTVRTGSPGHNARDMGQPKANSAPRDAQNTPVVSLAPAVVCGAHGHHGRGVGGLGEPSRQRVPRGAGRVEGPGWAGSGNGGLEGKMKGCGQGRTKGPAPHLAAKGAGHHLHDKAKPLAIWAGPKGGSAHHL